MSNSTAAATPAIEKTQRNLHTARKGVATPETNAVMRQHNITAPVYKYAVDVRMNFSTNRGQGSKHVPSHPDIYYDLFREGLELVEGGLISAVEFRDIVPADAVVGSPIKFPLDINKRLAALKERADAGDYPVTPGKHISYISLAVNLMELALQYRAGQVPGKTPRK